MDHIPSPITSPEHETCGTPGSWTHEEHQAAGRILDELEAIDSPPLSRAQIWLQCSKKMREIGFDRTAGAVRLQRRLGKARTAQSGESTSAGVRVTTAAEATATPSKVRLSIIN
jgi:hypothetical protein